jgi:hypothetical protein
MSSNEPIPGTTSANEGNAQNHDKVEGTVDVDKPSQAEGDTDATTS